MEYEKACDSNNLFLKQRNELAWVDILRCILVKDSVRFLQNWKSL